MEQKGDNTLKSDDFDTIPPAQSESGPIETTSAPAPERPKKPSPLKRERLDRMADEAGRGARIK